MEHRMSERINWYRKEYVYNQYLRITGRYNKYDRITKKKMLDIIYNKVYNNYNNIIDLCTFRELKYLEMLLKSEKDMKDLGSEEYSWERNTLRDKFLIQSDFEEIFIPDEILPKISEALANVNWSLSIKLTQLAEIIVGFCKVQGEIILDSIVSIFSALLEMDSKILENYLFSSRLFQYYVVVYDKDLEHLGVRTCLLYRDYSEIEELLDIERAKQGLASTSSFNLETYVTIFYHDFDIYNKKINLFLEEFKKLPFFWSLALEEIRRFALLNIDRAPLKKAIREVPALKRVDLTYIFKLLDKAMDEMPSGALNGLTPKEARKILKEQEKIQREKEESYQKQENACLDKKDAALFYKLYFALLDYTNQEYKIRPNLKIYKANFLNPQNLIDIIDTFYEKRNVIIRNFCRKNPYRFNKKELNMITDFKDGIRDIFFIVKFEREYTAFYNNEKFYMVKGLNDDIDNIINYKELPYIVKTTIFPFKKYLVYDGIFQKLEISFGLNMENQLNKEYLESIKYYHL